MRSLRVSIPTPVPIISVEPKPKFGSPSEQDHNREGAPLWVIQAMLPNAFDSEDVAKITVAGDQPEIRFGDMAELHGLTIQLWERDGRAGLTLKAEQITPAGGALYE